jgi:hypothetical protein
LLAMVWAGDVAGRAADRTAKMASRARRLGMGLF